MAADVLVGSVVFRVDLVIIRGATNRLRFRWSAGKPPQPVDMTGYTARAQVRRSRSAADTWLDLEDEVELGPDGYVTITVPWGATVGDEWDRRDRGVWDLELTLPNGDVRRLVQGDVSVSDEVTRG